MPTARATRVIAAPLQDLWELVSDPHHLPRWWPRVTRVEDVRDGAFTEVMKTKKGKTVRADFDVVRADEAEHTVCWRQRVTGTPFERVLVAAETELRLAPAAQATAAAATVPAAQATVATGTAPAAVATEVTLELRQTLAGSFPRFGLGYKVGRAANATVRDALDGLERIGA